MTSIIVFDIQVRSSIKKNIRQIRIRSTPIFHMNWINTKCSIFPQNWAETMPCCEISDCRQMSKTIIAVRHFWLGGCESLETVVRAKSLLEQKIIRPQHNRLQILQNETDISWTSRIPDSVPGNLYHIKFPTRAGLCSKYPSPL